MAVNRKDLACGMFFAIVGALYGIITWTTLPVGSGFSMGPGYFPIVLSAALVCLGIAIAVRGLFVGEASPFGIIPWRGVIMLSLATIIFAAGFTGLGMLPGVFLTTFVAALASPKVNLLKAAVVSICIAAFCTVVFSYGIRLPVPVVGTWFGS